MLLTITGLILIAIIQHLCKTAEYFEIQHDITCNCNVMTSIVPVSSAQGIN